MASIQFLKKQMERGNLSKADFNRQLYKIINDTSSGAGKSKKDKPMMGSGSCEHDADGKFSNGNTCGSK